MTIDIGSSDRRWDWILGYFDTRIRRKERKEVIAGIWNAEQHTESFNLCQSYQCCYMDVRQINNHLGSSQQMPQNYESGPDSVEWAN